MTTINVHDFKTNYSKYLERVIGGEEILLGKHGKAVAKIVPFSPLSIPRTPGALKGNIKFSIDFDEPLVDLWKTTGAK